MVGDISPEVVYRDVIIVGGGCYGSFYTAQMERARARGKAAYRRLLIVDRESACRVAAMAPQDNDARQLVVQDWADFFDDFLGQAQPTVAGEPPDAIVPSPLMPHLMYEWLVRRARHRWPGRVIETRPVTQGPRTPYDATGLDGTRYVSFADWLCPTHCIEPATCPVIRAPRTWDMADAMSNLAQRLNASHPTAGPVLFNCEHRVFGVGMFDVSAVLEGDALVAAAGGRHTPINVLVGTVSKCHGAASLLHLG